jgi:hypothetical protein
MTVCAAAISVSSIIGASDRMLTSGTGDIEFEPQTAKLHRINENICLMIAGDVTLQTEILYSVNESIPPIPGITWKVQEVAEAYFKAYQAVRKRRAEWAILHPLGLESASDVFLRGDLGARVASDLLNFKVPPIEALITGLDDSAPISIRRIIKA